MLPPSGSRSFQLTNKLAVVTGGSGLLGLQFARAFLEAGAEVAILDQREPTFTADLSRFIAEKRLLSVVADVTKKSSLEGALEKIRAHFGKTPNVLVNNAAIDAPPNAPVEENGPFETYPEASLDRILDVNVKGTILCCQVFGSEMAKEKDGSIINISSIYGLLSPVQDIYEYKRRKGENWFKPVGYSVSKSAVLNLTRYLATYWGKSGVRVNTLTPAGVSNHQDADFLANYLPRVPMGRMAKPEEIAGPAVFLASDAASYVTGSNLVADGGWTAW